MQKTVKRWFWTTMFVGIAPMIIRASLYALLLEPGSLQVITISDILVWGLVINICIFNEREGLLNYNPRISSLSTTVSVLLIVIFSILFVCGLINEAHLIFRHNSLLFTGGFFSVATLVTFIIFTVNSNPSRKREEIIGEGVH